MTPRTFAVAVLLCATVARIAAAILLGSDFHFADETHYVDAAKGILAGEGFGGDYNRVPAFPVFLAALLTVLPEPLVALRIAHAVIVGAAVFMTLRLGERLFDFPSAAVAALIVALDPLMVVSSALFYPETITAITVLALVMLALDAAETERPSMSVAAGLLIGVMVQLRQIALVFLPVFALWMFLRLPSPRLGRSAIHAAALVAGCLVALAPWSLRNLSVQGSVSPVATAGAQNTIAVTDSETEDKGLAMNMLENLTENPASEAYHTGKRFLLFFEFYPTRLATDFSSERDEMHSHDQRLPQQASFPRGLRDTVSAITYGVELLFAIIGIGFAWKRKPAETLLLLSVILSFAFGYALIVSKLRYRIPILPLLHIFSGVGFVGVATLAGIRFDRIFSKIRS